MFDISNSKATQKQKTKKRKIESNSLPLKAKKRKKSNANICETGKKEQNVDTDEADMSAWKDCFVPEPVLKALSELGFTYPTPIQALTLPSAIRDKLDILGAAETGSGKTLAFGIPLIHFILKDKMTHLQTENGNQLGILGDTYGASSPDVKWFHFLNTGSSVMGLHLARMGWPRVFWISPRL
ncbi:ATP-dependent RNA helicase DDX24-like [Centruroides sculpturatus]|uniref:ATP-dependent RNA helicase DDX24-like n=1 Tax=Centruroides sculpturatus TaxID=218467 RepID=UPI000C6DE945|nr:ATP-dependent RNA helicase DDX24-like [Centruroides sculpturatus]